jgi:catechol 2,3-dioxygenase-like lactoylglutathione lyase family enzyme
MPAPLPIESINHVSYTVADLEASRVFFRDVLGFREIQRPNFDFAGHWLFNYGVMIHLIQDSEPRPAEGPGEIRTRANHLALHTSDLDRVERLLEEHGVAFRRNQVPGRPIKQVFFRDPDGNHIEIGTYGPTPPPL